MCINTCVYMSINIQPHKGLEEGRAAKFHGPTFWLLMQFDQDTRFIASPLK